MQDIAVQPHVAVVLEPQRESRQWRMGCLLCNNKPIVVVTMVLPLAAAAARRRIGGAISSQVQKRTMAGGPAKEWEGIDKVVRGVFPGDHQRT